ncbi:MAG: hemolysin family protein [Nanoarchaeota archaeon]|nr:hemolysin family protein [Nanoarchaeota archaeon]
MKMAAVEIIILVVLILLSGFFSGIEIAFFSISNMRARHLAEKKVRGADTLMKLKSNPHRLLITILIGNNLVNIAASAIATVMAIDMFGSKGAGIAVGVMTLLILIFGEITPKAFATIYAENIALTVSKPVLVMQTIFMPITFFLDKFIKTVTKISGNREFGKRKISEEELRSIVNISHEAGGIGKEEKDMIHKIFEFDDIEVREIMVPRTDVVRLSADTSFSNLMIFLKKNKFTRVPVFQDKVDDIIGILYIKDLLHNIDKLNTKVTIKDLIKQVMFVPKKKKIDELLREFQKKKQHMAIVVDEHGGFLGIVTLEDILEEIVGEIYDENEIRKEMIRIVDNKTAIVDAETTLNKLNDALKLGFHKNLKRTLGAFVLEKLGRIPKSGDKIWFSGFDLIVDNMANNRVLTLKIIRKKGKYNSK